MDSGKLHKWDVMIFFFFWCCLFPDRLLSWKIIAKDIFLFLKKFHFKKDLERVLFIETAVLTERKITT